MPDHQILKITFNRETRNEKIYFRVERVGSMGFGGHKKPPYPRETIANYHASMIKRKEVNGDRPTLLDKAAVEAENIDVVIVLKDGLQNTTLKDANKIKAILIEEFKENNLDWDERLLNIHHRS